jgi:complex iron-sulfur molybdoenzyme family reductase subunit alpha
MQDGVPYSGFKFFVDQKKPWPTLTGRQQFYCDHEWFLEAGEALPVFKPPVDADRYPLRYSTSHFRHLMHSTWSEHTQILRLTRGGPCVLLNPEDARDRGLKDDDWAEIFNDYGRLIARIKLYPASPKGLVLMHFGYERFVNALPGNPRIKRGSSFQSPIPIRINPLLLVGKHYQLTFKPNYWGATGVQRDTRVEVKKHAGPVS